MKVSVCVGSACHLKGSKHVLEDLKALSEQNGLGDKVNLCSAFCMGRCQDGVSVSVEDKVFSVTPETVNEFFENEIKTKL